MGRLYHSYVSLPEGKSSTQITVESPNKSPLICAAVPLILSDLQSAEVLPWLSLSRERTFVGLEGADYGGYSKVRSGDGRLMARVPKCSQHEYGNMMGR